jgi:protein-S-isoprenylcysteine O-methyltransferase
MIALEQLGLLYGASEIALALARRSKRAGARSRDAGTLGLVWVVIAVSVTAAVWIARSVEFGRYEHGLVLDRIALALFGLGVALRGWAIVVLGRFFTVDVAIHEGHELVQRGPYRVLRHPSYTGALLVFFGFGVLFDSWPALAVATLPVVAIILRRIQVEERALAEHFGEAWRAHCARTWRLVPGVW